METSPGIIESLFETTESYAKTSYELVKLQIREFISTIFSKLIVRLSIVGMIFFIIFLVNVGVALWLGELLGVNYYGFFIVAGFYLILVIVMHFFLTEWIKSKIINFLVNILHQKQIHET
jgi:hypothetical protein